MGPYPKLEQECLFCSSHSSLTQGWAAELTQANPEFSQGIFLTNKTFNTQLEHSHTLTWGQSRVYLACAVPSWWGPGGEELTRPFIPSTDSQKGRC